jgi:hypothetical protein
MAQEYKKYIYTSFVYCFHIEELFVILLQPFVQSQANAESMTGKSSVTSEFTRMTFYLYLITVALITKIRFVVFFFLQINRKHDSFNCSENRTYFRIELISFNTNF